MSHRKASRLFKGKIIDITTKDKIDAALIASIYTPDSIITPAFYKNFSEAAWRLVCQKFYGNYQIITVELIQFLQHLLTQLPHRKAIEICSGYGTIAKELGIPATDRYLTEELSELYKGIGDNSIKYPAFVEKLTASQAIEKYQPDLVIGSFVTQKFISKKKTLKASMYGVDKHKLLQQVKHYIQISNDKIHGKDLVNDKIKYRIEAEWLISRAENQKQNAIYIFTDSELNFDTFPHNLSFDIIETLD